MRVMFMVAGLWLAGLFAVNTTQAQIGESSGADIGVRNNNATPTNFFFLHHSVGLGLINGGMRNTIAVYNAANGTAFALWDHGYSWEGLTGPDGVPMDVYYSIPGDNTNPDGLYDLWTSNEDEWVAGRTTILNNHQLIAFKSCFPASAIPDTDTLNQYKTWYLGMRAVFDLHPDHLFVVMSTPPLHRMATTAAEAHNARLFANWLASSEYLGGRDNLVCFNLFDYLAGPDNMLKYEYEENHSDSDSHPNETANQIVGPILANFFIQSALNFNPDVNTNLLAPGNITASDGTYEDRVVVTWSASANATHYEVWRNTQNSSSGATALDTDVVGTAYTDADVAQDTVYWYWVRAANSAQTSTFSIANSGYASDTPPPVRTGPIIRANGATGEVSVFRPDTVTLTVEMRPGALTGSAADWWVVAAPQGGDWYYLNSTRQWTPFTPGHFYQCTPVHQGALFNLTETTVLDAMPLGADVYSVYFGVDAPDGVLNYPGGEIWYDTVTITVE